MSQRVALLLLFGSAAASGHVEKFPKRDRLELSPSGARLRLDYAVPAGEEARSLRERFDRDRSGGLDPRERAALGEYLIAQATRFMSLTLDDHDVALADVALDAQLGSPQVASDARLAITVALEVRWALGDGAHRVRLIDRHKDRRVTVPVVVILDRLVPKAPLDPQPYVYLAHPLELGIQR